MQVILVGLALLPMTGMAFFAGSVALDRRAETSEARHLELQVNLSVRTGNLLHATQRERGATAVFLASGGTKFATQMTEQRRATNVARSAFESFLESSGDELPAEVLEPLEPALSSLAELEAHRASANELRSETAETISYYTSMNGNLLDSIASVATATSNADLQREATAYLAFLDAKERTGIERAQLASVFGTDEFAPGQLATVVTLIAARESYLDVFQSLADPEVVAFFRQTESDPVVAETAALEAIAVDNGVGGFGVDSAVWFETISARIDLLKEVEDFQADSILEHSELISSRAQQAFARSIAVALGVLVATMVLGGGAIFGLMERLRTISDRLADAAGRLDVVSGDLEANAEQTSREAAVASSTGDDVTARVADVATAVDEMNKSISEVGTSVQDASRVTSAAVDTARQTSETIVALGESSEQIGNVIKVIDNIAKQTNLLALNATIEAARAGEAGKGFAVVATEVKGLANQTALATQEIAAQIESIQLATTNAVEANAEVGSTIEKINSIATAIAGAIQQQTATTSEIGLNTSEAAANTDQIAAIIRQVADAAASTRNATNQTRLAASEMTETAAELHSVISGR